MKRAVIYARYSSSNQTEQSIEGQIRVCSEYAKAKGLTIIGEYIDRAISGRTDNRPDFQRLRQLLVIGINQKIAIQWDFPITYEMARAYQKANGKYLRQNQWEDITLVMSLELGK